MEPAHEAIQALIAGSVADLRADLQLPPISEINAATPLYGSGSDLDSMALVHLIADLEGRLSEQFGKDWILADDRALSRQRSPFRSVGDLANYIVESTPR